MSNPDTTNYKVYALLAKFGSTRQQLLAVAEVAELHELRQLRMLRLTFDLSLVEAQAELAKFVAEEAETRPSTPEAERQSNGSLGGQPAGGE